MLEIHRVSDIAWLDKLCDDEKMKPWDVCEVLTLYQTVRKVLQEEHPNTKRCALDEQMTAVSCLLLALNWYDEVGDLDFAYRLDEAAALCMLLELCFTPKSKRETPEQEKLLDDLSRSFRVYLSRTASGYLCLTSAKVLSKWCERTVERDGRRTMLLRFSPEEETFEMDEDNGVLLVIPDDEIHLIESLDDLDESDFSFLREQVIERKGAHALIVSTTWIELVNRYERCPRGGVFAGRKVKTLSQKGLCAFVVYVDGLIPGGKRETCVEALNWFEDALIKEFGTGVCVAFVPYDDAPQAGARNVVILGRRYGSGAERSKPKNKRNREGEPVDDDRSRAKTERSRFKTCGKLIHFLSRFMTAFAVRKNDEGTSTPNFVALLARTAAKTIAKVDDTPLVGGESLCGSNEECEMGDHPWVLTSKRGESLWQDPQFRRFFAERQIKGKLSNLCRFDFFRHYQVADVLSRFEGGLFWTRRAFLDEALAREEEDETVKVFSCKDMALVDNAASTKNETLNRSEPLWEGLRRKLAGLHRDPGYSKCKAKDLWKHAALAVDASVNVPRGIDLGYARRIEDSLKKS